MGSPPPGGRGRRAWGSLALLGGRGPGAVPATRGHGALGESLGPESRGGEELLTARGARRIRVSPSAPEFNPSAPCWPKSTTGLRRAKAGTVEAWIAALKQALDTVTAVDMRGWFTHGGYPVH